MSLAADRRPVGMTALRAAREDPLQTSIRLALGWGVAGIGLLTVPSVAATAWRNDGPHEPGVAPGGAVLLTISCIMALITDGAGRASLLSGVVRRSLLATWRFLVFAPSRRPTAQAVRGARCRSSPASPWTPPAARSACR